MTNIEELRKEAIAKIDEDEDYLCYRSCWNCNGAHEHLKEVDYVILCFECGKYFYKGTDVTDYHETDFYPRL